VWIPCRGTEWGEEEGTERWKKREYGMGEKNAGIPTPSLEEKVRMALNGLRC
jgi:hypothetical protein